MHPLLFIIAAAQLTALGYPKKKAAGKFLRDNANYFARTKDPSKPSLMWVTLTDAGRALL